MDRQSSHRFWLAVAAIMILLSLADVALFGLVIGDPVDRALSLIVDLIVFLTVLFAFAIIILVIVGFYCRRDDPRYANRPHDLP